MWPGDGRPRDRTYARGVDATTYRRILLVSGIALGVVVATLVALNPTGRRTEVPAPLEEVFPLPGDTVVRQTAIEVDLPVGYELSLAIDGIEVPEGEIGVTEATGQHVWQPGPSSLFASWTPGDHIVRATWERYSGGVPDRGSFTWAFRVV